MAHSGKQFPSRRAAFGAANGNPPFNAPTTPVVPVYVLPLDGNVVSAASTTDTTITRALSSYTIDFEDIARPIRVNEFRFMGFRRIENLYTGSATLATQDVTTLAAEYTVSFSGTGSITFTGTSTESLTGTGAGTRVMLTFTATAGTLTSTVAGSVTDAQLEFVSGQANKVAGEYTDSATSYGAGVNGVQYLSTTNGNTATGTPLVVTGGTGVEIVAGAAGVNEAAPVNQYGPWGLLPSFQRDELLGADTIRRSMTDVGWVATNITVDTATGFDGVPGAAARLTASAADATILYQTALASSFYVWEMWIRRVSGVGDVQLTLDGGTTWFTIPVTDNYKLSGLLASPIVPHVGYRIRASSDVIEVDFNQINAFDVQMIPLPTGAVTTFETTSLTNNSYVLANQGAVYVELTPATATTLTAGTPFWVWYTQVDGNNNLGLRRNDTTALFRKQIAGVDTFATQDWTLVIGRRFKVAVSWGPLGQHIFIDGVQGTPDADATAAQVGAVINLGSQNGNAPLQVASRNWKFFDVQPSESFLLTLTHQDG